MALGRTAPDLNRVDAVDVAALFLRGAHDDRQQLVSVTVDTHRLALESLLERLRYIRARDPREVRLFLGELGAYELDPLAPVAPDVLGAAVVLQDGQGLCLELSQDIGIGAHEAGLDPSPGAGAEAETLPGTHRVRVVVLQMLLYLWNQVGYLSIVIHVDEEHDVPAIFLLGVVGQDKPHGPRTYER